MSIDFTPLRRTARSLGLVTVGVLSTLGALSLTHVGPVQALSSASSPGVSLAALQAKIGDLQTRVTYLETHPNSGPAGPKGDTGSAGPQGSKGDIGNPGANGKDGTNGTNGVSGAAGKDGAPGLVGAPGAIGPQGPKGDTGLTGANGTNGTNGRDGTNGKDGINGKNGAQGPRGDVGPQGPAGASPFTVSGTEVTLSGYNLNIVNGLNSTETINGLGNLIIGYNEFGNENGDIRTGSHNLVVGGENSYSSFGGLIAGYKNTVSNQYSSVSGGSQGTASGKYSSVSGGYADTASNQFSTVSGGPGITNSTFGGWSGGSYHSP